MIPLRDANPVRSTPIVNRLLLAINLVAWIYVVYLSRQPGALDAFYERYSFDWLEFTRRIAAGDLGVDTFVPLISHMFLHGGWLHVIGNMLYLWIFGDNVEDRLGSARYLVFYLLCGIVAAIGQGLISPSPMVGASGAIAGVLGAYLLMYPTARISTLVFLGLFITIVELPASPSCASADTQPLSRSRISRTSGASPRACSFLRSSVAPIRHAVCASDDRTQATEVA